MNYLINQRVIVGKEIGTVVEPEDGRYDSDYIWVFRPSKRFASKFSVDNVKPLPNNQL